MSEVKSPTTFDILSIAERLDEELEKAPGKGERRSKAICLLNLVLAAEFVCLHQVRTQTTLSTWEQPVAQTLESVAKDDFSHADLVAGRIAGLRGTPQFTPSWLPANGEGAESRAPDAVIADLLSAKRTLVSGYKRLRGYLDEVDAPSGKLIEEIWREDEEHVALLTGLVSAGAVAG